LTVAGMQGLVPNQYLSPAPNVSQSHANFDSSQKASTRFTIKSTSW
jgi:hypothetical protein